MKPCSPTSPHSRGERCVRRSTTKLIEWSSLLSLSAATLAGVASAWDEVSELKVLDHSLEDSVVAHVDVLDLDLGLVWDEIHLSFSLL